MPRSEYGTSHGSPRPEAVDGASRRQCPTAPSTLEHRRVDRRRSLRSARWRLRTDRGGAGEGSGGMTSPVRHFLDLTQFGAEEIRGILAASVDMKRARKRGERQTVRPLEGKTLAMIFDKPSTRTRVSFDVAMRELGGETIMLTGAEMQLGRGETIGDTARVLSRYVDAIVIRMLDQNAVRELAEGATVPVINGLTKAAHPCQIMADVMTYEEHRGSIKGKTVAWVGDSNNVLASWVHAAARLDFRVNIASPDELAPPADLLAWARREGARVSAMNDPYDAVEGADCVVTDCWVSMGDEDAGRRHNLLAPYQVNAK